MNNPLKISIVLLLVTSFKLLLAQPCNYTMDCSSGLAINNDDGTLYTGQCTKSYKNGKTEWDLFFENGLLVEEEYWNNKGEKKFKRIYEDTTSKRFRFYSYNKTGCIKSITDFVVVDTSRFILHTEIDGVEIRYTDDEIVDYRSELFDYRYNGRLYFFLDNSDIFMNDKYMLCSKKDSNEYTGKVYKKNEDKTELFCYISNGVIKEYHINYKGGQLKDSLSFFGNNLDFKHYQFYKNGAIKSICTIQINEIDNYLPVSIVMNNELLMYDGSGNLTFEINYSKGKLSGKYNSYFEGSLSEKRIYKNGVLTNPSYKWEYGKKYEVIYDTTTYTHRPKLISKTLIPEK